MSKTFTLAELVEECEGRQRDAEKERDDCKRYVVWMRSPEGQAERSGWMGDPDSIEDDAEFFDEETRFWAAIARQLRPIGRRQRLLLQSKDH
jgi:hypothetical protein